MQSVSCRAWPAAAPLPVAGAAAAVATVSVPMDAHRGRADGQVRLALNSASIMAPHCRAWAVWALCLGLCRAALRSGPEPGALALRFGPPVELNSSADWYDAPAIDGYTSLGSGVIVAPWKRGLNFSFSSDFGASWGPRRLSLGFPGGEDDENYTTIVQGGFVRGGQAAGSSSLGHTLGTLPVDGTTCRTRPPGLCDTRAAALCPHLACNQTHSPLSITVTYSSGDGLGVTKACRQVGVRGLQRPLLAGFGLAGGFTGPSGPVQLADGSLVMTWPIKFADSPEHKAPAVPPGTPPPKHRLKSVNPMSLIAVRSVDGGFMWNYAGDVATSEAMPWSWYGPNEHDVAVLADNKTLLVVFRPDSDGFCPGTPAYRFYYQAYSYDGGLSWSKPRPIPGVGCVRPRLLRLDSGALLLSGGRLCPSLVGNGTGGQTHLL
jgi:hypothetical protein